MHADLSVATSQRRHRRKHMVDPRFLFLSHTPALFQKDTGSVVVLEHSLSEMRECEKAEFASFKKHNGVLLIFLRWMQQLSS
jgi:hypothetical protein